ncbi:universal stress protein [Panacibacter sp. DH6]|uniref:Universal stress protein n=1 Tax=Panacibacter microcysteis TaxID=2793269 RepID=A0A931GU25_9BACT|nr:universal stress protein [Panacibacter microcysteis]MBG9374935.1 universal stress protein [Panacibacter microcysteis]
MQKNLYNILVPVDFSPRDRWAISKAIELANALHCNIHLVHVVSSASFPLLTVEAAHFYPYDRSADMKNAQDRLHAMKEQYKQHLCGKGQIEISVLSGSEQEELVKYTRLYNMDMVVKGLSKFNLLHRIVSTVNISNLAKKTAMPVLGVRASGLVSHFKKIVLPLHDDHIPMRRIRLAALLGRYFKSTIFVVSLRKGNNEPEIPILSQTLEVIQSLTTIPVQSIILEGKNLATTTLNFSKKINADLIMINNKHDYYLPGMWNRITKRLLSYNSKIPVITLEKE